MRRWANLLSGVALLGVVAAAPAMAGHYGGYSKATKQAMPHMGGHPHCRGKMMANKGMGYGHGPYGPMRGWKHGHRHPQGHYGHMKRKGYGHGGPMMGPRSKTTDPYGASPKQAPGAPSTEQPSGTGEAVKAAPKNIVETAVAAEQFATLVSAVKAADLVETLSGNGPFTVFAPTDAAFQRLPEGTVPGLLNNIDALKGVLTYHVVQGRLTAADLLEQGSVETLSGAKLNLTQLRVAKADVAASNGVIHIVDEVLLPPQS